MGAFQVSESGDDGYICGWYVASDWVIATSGDNGARLVSKHLKIKSCDFVE